MDSIIERPQTEAEKSDFKLLGTPTLMDLFNSELSKKVFEYTKKFKPYDAHCARLDFRDKIEQAEKESQRSYGYVKETLGIDFGDLDKYGDENRFEFVDDREEYQEILLDGLRTQKVIGHTIDYRCKLRGHGISVFIPIVEYNERFFKKKKE